MEDVTAVITDYCIAVAEPYFIALPCNAFPCTPFRTCQQADPPYITFQGLADQILSQFSLNLSTLILILGLA
jgi:hypothetical protein